MSSIISTMDSMNRENTMISMPNQLRTRNKEHWLKGTVQRVYLMFMNMYRKANVLTLSVGQRMLLTQPYPLRSLNLHITVMYCALVMWPVFFAQCTVVQIASLYRYVCCVSVYRCMVCSSALYIPIQFCVLYWCVQLYSEEQCTVNPYTVCVVLMCTVLQCIVAHSTSI